MNINKSLLVICGTIVLVCGLFLLKPLIPSAPERLTSDERVMLQPERVTSIERVESQRLSLVEKVITNQMTSAEIAQSNTLYFQTQQQVANQLQRSNYYAAKAEFTSAWAERITELKSKRNTDQNTMTLAHMELKSKIEAKYNLSLDTLPEPVSATPASVVVVQSMSPETRVAPLRFPVRKSRMIQGASNQSSLASLRQQYAQEEAKMHALERAGRGYVKQSNGTVLHWTPPNNWVQVDASKYDPTYDRVRIPKDALSVRIQSMERGQ